MNRVRLLLALACFFAAGVLSAPVIGLNGPPGRAPVPTGAAEAPFTGSAPTEAFDSIFIRLDTEIHQVPHRRHGSGGGLSGFGEDIVLVTYEGRIFRYAGGALRETAIVAPDNGFDAFDAYFSTGPGQGREVVRPYFRYNDILGLSDGPTPQLILSYTEWHAEAACHTTTLAVLDLPAGARSLAGIEAAPADWRILFRTAPCLPPKPHHAAVEGQMAGGRIARLDAGHIVLASGDYSWDGLHGPEKLARQTGNDYGKVLRIDLAGGAARTISIGHSNPQGIAVDDIGRIWVVEHGRRGGDELNLIEPGGDYGWPEATLGTRYGGMPWPGSAPEGSHEGYRRPVFAFLPSIGTATVAQIRGMDPRWDGDLLVGGLVSQSLHRVRIREGRALFVEPILVGARVRDVEQHAGGVLAIWDDDLRLVLARVSARDRPVRVLFDALDESDLAPEPRRLLKEALLRCAECHSFGHVGGARGPALGDVYGRAVAATDFAGYSAALRARGGRWDAEALAAYLADPQAAVPGTAMADPGIADPQVLDQLVALLRWMAPEGR